MKKVKKWLLTLSQLLCGRGDEKQRRREGEALFEAVKEADVERVRDLCQAAQARLPVE